MEVPYLLRFRNEALNPKVDEWAVDGFLAIAGG